jgi:hypothetical protein
MYNYERSRVSCSSRLNENEKLGYEAATCRAVVWPTAEKKEREIWQLASLADEAPGSGVVVVCRRVGMGSFSRLLLGEGDRGVGVDSRDGLGIVAVD